VNALKATNVLEIVQLSKKWKDFSIEDVSLKVEKNEYFVIMGPTGAGKTLLLQLIAGIHTPDKGKIIIEGEDVTFLPSEKRRVGYVPQNYALFPHLSVMDNIAYGLRAQGLDKDSAKKRVISVAEDLGISHLLKRKISTLSGGEQQRVALARALVISPKVLLLDEPLSALDAQTREGLRSYLRELKRKLKLTAIHVTHDFVEALELGDRLAVMFRGRLTQVGSPNEIIFNPRDELIAHFTGFKNVFDGVVVEEKDGVSVIDIDGIKIFTITNKQGAVRVAIRPESILIARHPITTSARNMLKGVVQEVIELAPHIVIKVDAGIPLTVYLTKSALEELNIRVGTEVYLLFKASDVKVF